MTFRTSIFVLALAVAAAEAQSGIAPIDTAHRAAKVANSQTAETNKALPTQEGTPAKAAPAGARTTPIKPAPAKPAATATKAPVKPAAAKKAAEKPVSAAAVEKQDDDQDAPKSASAVRANRRDPFISIIRTDTATKGSCTSGKKCLVVGDIVLRGIVRSPNATIAVVENPDKKTYFLHENDPVFNGQVVKITTDAVIFREQIYDRAGRSTTREITKHLNTRPIA
jgi:hypothetical protein